MVRTSVVLPAGLHQRLVIVSKREDKSLSELVRELLNRSLSRHEQSEVTMMHEALKNLDGIGERNIADTSTTIDDVLYAEEGAWRGNGA